MEKRPIIGITMGDPVGVGPEIILKAFTDPLLFQACRPLVIGDPEVLDGARRLVNSAPPVKEIRDLEAAVFTPNRLEVFSAAPPAAAPIFPGKPTPATGRAMAAAIARAVDLALAGKIDGMATCPINKRALRMAGFDYPGHTEMLAMLTGARDFAMMLAASRLRVVLVTIHVPLKEVHTRLSAAEIEKRIRLTHLSLKERFGLPAPRIAVAGLNPHAGEEGLFGDEEARVIGPAVESAKAQKIAVSGPWPPDTVFYQAAQGKFDAVVCMYHDQGLIPFKLLHFADGVNTTLGLPIIRTSVDHGTAYDIAGTGQADPASLLAAVQMAARQAICRLNHQIMKPDKGRRS